MGEQDEFMRDLRDYSTGKTENGLSQFEIPMRLDDDGMFGCECPNSECEPRYFKMAPPSDSNDSKASITSSVDQKPNSEEIRLTCPYCGWQGEQSNFFTRSQIEMFRAMIFHEAAQQTSDMFEKSTHLTFKRTRLPSVRHYAEEKLKRRIICDQCGFRYAVFGIGFYCPGCGEGNLLLHLGSSISVIRALVECEEIIVQKAGEEGRHHLFGNCLEDIVSLFEGFMKHIYERALRSRNIENVQARLMKLRVSFQRLNGAEEFFKNDFGINIFETLNDKEREQLGLLFTKRHVITHNLGLVDPKFQAITMCHSTIGREIEITGEEIEQGLQLTRQVLEYTASIIL